MSATPTFTSYITYPGSLLEPSLLDLTIKSATILNGQSANGGSVYDAWCMIENIDLPVPATYTTALYASTELGTLAAAVPTLANNKYLGNLDNINWLLNWYNGSNAAYGDVQGAIWKMLGSTAIVDYVGPQSATTIDALVAEAMQHDGYVPGIGDKIAAVVDTMQGSTHRQPLLVTMQAASIGDTVWHDTNANGIQDAGEAGIAGATVQLVRDQNQDGDFSDANEVLATTTTDSSGHYAFKGLTPGLTYQVVFSLPSGYDTVSPRQADGNAPADGNSDALVSNPLVLAPGENNGTVDAGFYNKASLGDRVWADTNGNGQQDSGEAGIAGATVTLIGGGKDGLISTAADNTSVTTTTDANGNYKFGGLTPGMEYQVQFAAPSGSAFTAQDKGNDASDSDAGGNGLSQIVKLASGENNTTIDAGVYAPASLGDRVWLDANANGQQDNGEAGVAGATVTLIGGGKDGLISTTADNTSITTTTDANGGYKFTGLTPGMEYQVQFAAPSGSVFTAQDKGDDTSDSDAGSNGLSHIVKLASGENNTTVDAGVYAPASLGDRVWLDANANGQQDSGEAGVAGATVTLISGGADGLISTTDDNTSVTTTTDANGNYKFGGLTPGMEYQVQFAAPSGSVFTAQDKGDDASDSDAGSNGLSQIVKLAPGENNTTVDAGVYVPASLGDRVWVDANANGQQDSGEAGVAGATVTLIGGGKDGLISTTADNTSVTTTTDANGNYKFTGLTPGIEYQVQFAAPSGNVFTAQDKGDDASDSDAGATGLSQIVKLASGENNTTIDAGVYAPASLGDRVWLDANANGQQDSAEVGVAGATVTLVSGGADGLISTTGDNTSVTTTTDANGNYKFTGLTPGMEYQVQFEATSGNVFTAQDKGNDASDSDAGSNGLSQIVKLASGENNTTIDAGVYAPASLGDRVWLDANANGQQDSGEVGVAGATVTLVSGGADGLISTTGDNTSVTTTTDANGGYKFTGLTPGMEYQVQFEASSGSVFTAQDKGDDVSDSDAGSNGLSQIVKLASGENNTTIDAGVYAPASLGDRVWVDANANGQQDSGEVGVAGATVTLISGGADGLISTTGDNTSVTTTTDANGNYKFGGLTPGIEYQVQFEAPSGSVFTAQDKGDDASDSDANATGLSQVVKLASGENNTTIDAGVYAPASLGDRVWVDANANGQQDSGEAGVAGATVTLIGGGKDGLISTTADNTSVTTTTDANGNYKFGGLTPGIEYQVQFEAPSGSVFTAQDKGDDASDSDAGATGLSQIVKLASGENNTTIDAGVYAPASLGDRVWVDANANGQQDSGEAGVAGATVTLIGGGKDGLISTTADNTSVTTTTDANGNYKFTGLTPGMEYQVQFAPPSGSMFTAQDKGDDTSDSDAGINGLSQIVKLASGENNTTIDAGVYAPASLGDRVWLDANANGQQDSGEAGVAGATVTLIGGGKDGLISTTADNTSVTTTTDANGGYKFTGLTPGMEYQVKFAAPNGTVFTAQDKGNDASDSDAGNNGLSQVVKLASGENNTTIDAGVYAPASLGDRVWLDANANGQQDSGEAGVAGVTVTLVGGGVDGLVSTAADNTTLVTKTAADGTYAFTGLTPGQQYQVQFGLPSGHTFTKANVGSDASDSDAGAGGLTPVVVLQSGENNKTLDAGVVNTSGDLSIAKTDGLTNVLPGQSITYTVVAKNTGTATATDALVTDSVPSYLTNVTWTSSASTGASGNQVSGSGNISDNITLLGGASVTYTVKATVASMTALEKVADFGSMTNNTNLGQGITVGNVHADAAYLTSGNQIANAALWARNADGDHGLGVYSAGESSPTASGSTTGELSNQTHPEVIRLTLAEGQQWSSLWVSSLDKNSAGGAEIGTMYWSDSAIPDLSTAGKFTFKSGDFGVGAESGDLLSLRPANFDANAKYVFFVAGSDATTTKNDFLVWKAGTIPEQIVNNATIGAPTGFTDTNSGNNTATDTDHINVPTPPAVVRGSIGDTVWEDMNYNGVRDSGESGIANVTVRLLDNSNNVLATTTTNSSGNYLFNNLNAGNYKIEVVQPSGYYVTKPNVGSNDAIDSDIDTTTARSGTIALSQGENDLTWDAGLYRKASIGDKVWRDSDHDDIQDANEEGIGGIKVMLYSSTGTLMGTTTTNSSGNYKFANLDPGSYYLKFDKTNVMFSGFNMNTWKWASKDIGTNDAIDSDVAGDGVATTNVTKTDVTTLKSGENDMTWDAAITPIAIDLNGDGVHTVARSASTAAFDLLGNGKAIQSGWLSADDGFLAVDTNGNGKIDSIGELFGGSDKGAGFAKLATYDSNGDGVVDMHDAAFAELRVWRDANGNHATDAGELITLAQAGVVSLTVAHVDVPFVDAQGNLHLERSSATLAGGTVADMTDVYFAVDAKDAPGAATLADLLAHAAQAADVHVSLVGQAHAMAA